MPRDPNVSVGVCTLLHYRDYILLGHRCGDLAPDTWALPGGWQETGEQPIETAIRELDEECGIVMEPQHLEVFSARSVEAAGTWCTTIHFVGHRPINAEPVVKEPDKLDDWKWFHYLHLPPNLMASTKLAVGDWCKFMGYD